MGLYSRLQQQYVFNVLWYIHYYTIPSGFYQAFIPSNPIQPQIGTLSCESSLSQPRHPQYQPKYTNTGGIPFRRLGWVTLAFYSPAQRGGRRVLANVAQLGKCVLLQGT